MVFTFLSTTVIKGQESVLSARPYKIITDTITKIDTTYVIDTIINTYQYVVTDTIYEDSDNISKEKKATDFHKFEGNFGITLNQLAITHWAAGGESSGSGRVTSHITYTYDKNLF